MIAGCGARNAKLDSEIRIPKSEIKMGKEDVAGSGSRILGLFTG